MKSTPLIGTRNICVLIFEQRAGNFLILLGAFRGWTLYSGCKSVERARYYPPPSLPRVPRSLSFVHATQSSRQTSRNNGIWNGRGRYLHRDRSRLSVFYPALMCCRHEKRSGPFTSAKYKFESCKFNQKFHRSSLTGGVAFFIYSRYKFVGRHVCIINKCARIMQRITFTRLQVIRNKQHRVFSSRLFIFSYASTSYLVTSRKRALRSLNRDQTQRITIDRKWTFSFLWKLEKRRKKDHVAPPSF